MKCPECGRDIKKGEKCYFCGNKMIGRNIGLLIYIPAVVFFLAAVYIKKGFDLELYDYILICIAFLAGLVFFKK